MTYAKGDTRVTARANTNSDALNNGRSRRRRTAAGRSHGSIGLRRRSLLRLLWNEGRLCRLEIHELTGLNPNTVGTDIGALLRQGLIRECYAPKGRLGRPRVPLEIDVTNRHVVGLAVGPRRIEACRLNLRGNLIGRTLSREAVTADALVATSQRLIRKLANEESLGVGFSITGAIDAASRSLVSGSALRGQPPLFLGPISEAAGDRPVIVENDMHALAARWLLTHRAEAVENVLLVRIDDGELGAAILTEGHPLAGCVNGANELGHNRFHVETDRCYCGHSGCLERICSSAFLERLSPGAGPLRDRAARFDGHDAAIKTVIDYLAMGIANAANLLRPNRLVLVSELTRYAGFNDALVAAIRAHLLMSLVPRTRIDLWDQPTATSAETAGWLALANLYHLGWNAARSRTLANGDRDRHDL